MREQLLEYYERELNYLRQAGGEFARKYPKVAGRLLLDENRCEDPHVSRLLEGFAFLAARVHLRMDDDFHQICESLLRIVHPSYLQPIPSMTIVECLPDAAQGKKTAGVHLPRGTALVSKATVDGQPCRFRTAYDVDLWPLAVQSAEWRQPERMRRPPAPSNGEKSAAVVSLLLRCTQDVTFAKIPLSRLRFHLCGDANIVYALYELLASRCFEVQLRDPKDESKIAVLPASSVRMVGFDPDESLLPFDRRSVDAHRLLHEYFAFPEKFLFLDLSGLEALARMGFGEESEIIFLIAPFDRAERQQILELGVSARTFRLGCTPAINLFSQFAEPILLNQTTHEYAVIPDHRHASGMEVFSIEAVHASNPRLKQKVPLEPLFAYRHQSRGRKELTFWDSRRKINPYGDREPSVVSVSVVDLSGEFADPEADVLLVNTLCTNFDLPTRFPFGAEAGDFEAVGCADARIITAIRRPTPTVSAPAQPGYLWRLVSLLSLNYLSLTEGGKKGLQEILRLHNLTGESASENQVGSIVELHSKPGFALTESAYGLVPARGTCVEIRFEEQQFAGSSLYLFAAVLNRFLAAYASMNSFCQLTAFSTLRKEPIGIWRPQAGTQSLL